MGQIYTVVFPLCLDRHVMGWPLPLLYYYVTMQFPTQFVHKLRMILTTQAMTPFHIITRFDSPLHNVLCQLRTQFLNVI